MGVILLQFVNLVVILLHFCQFEGDSVTVCQSGGDSVTRDVPLHPVCVDHVCADPV